MYFLGCIQCCSIILLFLISMMQDQQINSSERMALCTILINELELYSLLGIGINCKSNPKLIRMVLVLDTAAEDQYSPSILIMRIWKFVYD